jgi:uncharacterized protein (TIGR02265 family)
MFFNGVLDAARALGGEEIRARCFSAAGEKKYVDFFSYPVADFLKSIFMAAELLGPKLGGREAVFRQLGRRATDDFLNSTVGKTMLALAGNDPKRLLSSFPSAYKASLSYGERTLEWLTDQHARLVARHDFLPLPYEEGVLLAALERSTARNVRVVGQRVGVLDVDYDISWT